MNPKQDFGANRNDYLDLFRIILPSAVEQWSAFLAAFDPVDEAGSGCSRNANTTNEKDLTMVALQITP
jgi:hypothetical protein